MRWNHGQAAVAARFVWACLCARQTSCCFVSSTLKDLKPFARPSEVREEESQT